MMCHRIGWPPISTIGLGRSCVSSDKREPTPPASMTTFMAYDRNDVYCKGVIAPRARSAAVGGREQRHRLADAPPDVAGKGKAALAEASAGDFIGQLVHDRAVDRSELQLRHELADAFDDIAHGGIEREHIIDTAVEQIAFDDKGDRANGIEQIEIGPFLVIGAAPDAERLLHHRLPAKFVD